MQLREIPLRRDFEPSLNSLCGISVNATWMAVVTLSIPFVGFGLKKK
jgi:hypothetical protein